MNGRQHKDGQFNLEKLSSGVHGSAKIRLIWNRLRSRNIVNIPTGNRKDEGQGGKRVLKKEARSEPVSQSTTRATISGSAVGNVATGSTILLRRRLHASFPSQRKVPNTKIVNEPQTQRF